MHCSLYWPEKARRNEMAHYVDYTYMLIINGGEDLLLEVTTWFDANSSDDDDPSVITTSWEPRIPLCDSTINAIQEKAYEIWHDGRRKAKAFRQHQNRCRGY